MLLVEGREDKVALSSLLSYLSSKLKKFISNGSLIIDELNGAGNLQHKISLYDAFVCNTHCYLDNDDAGQNAVNQAMQDGMLQIADYNLTICNGMLNSEFEDIIDVSFYKDKIETEYHIELKSATFRTNKKWS